MFHQNTHESIQIDEVIFLRKKSDDAEFHQHKKMARNRISIGHKQTLFKDENELSTSWMEENKNQNRGNVHNLIELRIVNGRECAKGEKGRSTGDA